MQTGDIRALKAQLREEYRAKRLALTPDEKARRDEQVAQTVRKLWQYRRNDTLLVYVSLPIEVDTRRIIENALADGKRVAVPRCVPDTRDMEFYYISSLDELSIGSFGVLEPKEQVQTQMTDFEKGLCLVPAFCYDYKGYRLGYGKGYYDRFLARFGGQIVGLCYSDCIRHTLPHGRFDRTVELIVTDTFIRKTNRTEGKR